MGRQDKKKLALHLDNEGWKIASRGSGTVTRSTRKLRADQSRISAELRQAATTLQRMGDSSMSGDSNSAKWKSHMINDLSTLQVGFPKAVITKLRYADILALSTTSGSASFYNYRPNSVFDPDQSGIGHQPMFFDNYASIYNRYRVLGATINVVFTPSRDFADDAGLPQRSSMGGPWVVGIVGTNNTANYSNIITTRMEANESVFKTLNTRTGADGVVSCQLAYSPETTLGRPAGDDTVSANVTASPTAIWNWQVWAQDTNSVVANTFVSAHVDIEYTVEFYDIINQAQN